VPVMKRPKNAQPFMDSLRASTGMCKVYAIADPKDVETVEAWNRAGAKVIATSTKTTFAERINLGFKHTNEPFVFITGDDVRFHSGWLDHAQTVAGDKIHVVGTNDLGNPRVMAGEKATHLLIRRSYVDEVGASWDGPKIVGHEGYRHWFVDTEICQAAKDRGVWGMALGSVVEHLHPMWDKAEADEVYELGAKSSLQDQELFTKRLAANSVAQ